MDGGARFEGKWIQDESGQRCCRSVNGSHYYGSAWFEIQGMENLKVFGSTVMRALILVG